MATRQQRTSGTWKATGKFSSCGVIAETPLEELYVSVVTLAEIKYGVERAPNRVRVDELERWLANTVRPMFQGRVLALSKDVLVR